ncbi:MAG: Fis family transcriptional regulator [Deltaproteobacteria bacterium RIFOXYD12_FULL_57_12]|nr:MAG: Fis family transcriptional regulator [Deltaproteobacteria bacterium RIFOXYD12_FULL_57_12]
MKNILVATPDPTTSRLIRSCFPAGDEVSQQADKEGALQLLRRKHCDFLFIDIDLLRDPAQGNGYKTALHPFWLLAPNIEIIVMSAPAMIREAVMAVKAGASNFLTYPLNVDEVKYVTDSLYESVLMQSELNYLRNKFWQVDSLNLVQTRSPLMQEVYDKVRSVAPTISTVLLVGETGTGKGVLAKLIHQHSNRSVAQFISIHCGAIPETLLESDLFGHEKGAFTGATRRKIGKFEIAKDGTIFLDEIGTITAAAQIKFLQILQDKTFQRVGGTETIGTNVRVIAATNSDLRKMCDDGQFRKDLYYRLNVFPVEIPPLRERPEDIPLLVEVFLKRFNKFHAKEIHGVDAGALEALTEYAWPGNIRELENLIERAYILETSSILTPESFPGELFKARPAFQPRVQVDASLSLAQTRARGVEQIERCYLKELLTNARGRINLAAERAGITSRQLHKLMKKHDLRKEDFRLAGVSDRA